MELTHLVAIDCDTGEKLEDFVLTEGQRLIVVEDKEEDKENAYWQKKTVVAYPFYKVSKNFFRDIAKNGISKTDLGDLFVVMRDLSSVDNSLCNSGHKYSIVRVAKVLGISREMARRKMRVWEEANILRGSKILGKPKVFVNPNYFSCSKFVLQCVVDLFKKGEDNGRSEKKDDE